MTRKVLNFQYDLGVKVSKGAKNRNRYNQVPHLTQDTNGKVTHLHLTKHTNGKVTNSQLYSTNESQEVNRKALSDRRA